MTTASPSHSNPTPLGWKSEEAGSRSHQGSLRSKLVLALAAVFFLFLMIDELVRQRVIKPEFVALEEAGAARDANRVLAAMNAEVEHLRELAQHWSAQIHEAETLNGAVAALSEDTTGSLSWKLRSFHFAAAIQQDGDWNWLCYDGKASRSEDSEPVSESFSRLVESCCQSSVPYTNGMTRIDDHRLIMFAVVDLASKGPVHDPDHTRFLLLGREIDENLVTRLRRQTQVEFSLQTATARHRNDRLVIWEADPSTLVAEVQLVGSDDRKLANIYIEIPRDIMARSRRTTLLARNSFVFGSVAALLMLLFLLQRIVIGPLTAMRKHSDRVAEEGLSTEPLVFGGNDEIAELAQAFDKMVNRLSDAQNELAKASQAAGRSQVASTVIHNVGNVLTNINSLIDAACDRTGGLRIAPLDKLAHRLRNSRRDEHLLEATPNYLERLAGSLKSDQQCIEELLGTLHHNVQHIHDVIQEQRQHTKHPIKYDLFELRHVIDEAIACCRARLQEDSVQVHISGDLDYEVRSDQSLILQTMINLIGNAHQALKIEPVFRRELRIEVDRVNEAIRIAVIDNGRGMDEATIQRVFDAHFTTRENGTGLGLHFCAVTLKRLGGSISAASDGIGRGSRFTITLPLHHHDNTDSSTMTAVKETP